MSAKAVREGSASSATTLVRVLAALAFCGAAASVLLSVGGTGDTPCGSLISPNFASGPAEAVRAEGSCAIVHRSAAATAAGLVAVGVGLLVIDSRSSAVARRATLIIGVATALAAAYASIGVSIGSSDAGNTMQRGWNGSRTLVAWTAAALALALTIPAVQALVDRNADRT